MMRMMMDRAAAPLAALMTAGRRVRCAHTGAYGVILDATPSLGLAWVRWDDGSESGAAHSHKVPGLYFLSDAEAAALAPARKAA